MDADALIADLDPDQRLAVTSPSLLVAVVAGAGSGKTRVLTRRVAYRIALGEADPKHTLALTFTREAAGELRRRLIRLGLRDHVEAGTFHAVMLRVLRQRWAETECRPRTVVADRRRLLRDAQSEFGFAASRHDLSTAHDEISWATARGIGPDRYPAAARRGGRRPAGGSDAIGAIFGHFVALKRRRGVIDFDDVLLDVLADAERDTDFADGLRWRFRHLLVDEAQDLNPVQQRIVDLLRAGRDDLFMVGDPAQAVYGFNGADPRSLTEVDVRFPGVEVIRLPVNHRCTPQIVAAGAHVLATGGQPTEIHSVRDDGAVTVCHRCDDEVAEAVRIATEIATGDPNLVRSGAVAVLARTNAQLAAFATALTERGVHVRRSGPAGGSPIDAAVRDASANTSPSALRAWAHDTLDDITVLDQARARVETLASPTPADDRTPPSQRTPVAAQVGEATAGLALVEAERRVATALLQFLREQPRGDGADFRSWIATTNPFDDRSTDGVELLSFHAAKGREWHTVYVSGLESGLMPHRSATTAPERGEEARLLYVALTRATDVVVLSWAERRGGYARRISPLIADLDVSTPLSTPPPRSLRRRATVDPVRDRLTAWRSESALRAHVVPSQLLTDHDLATIAAARPTTPEELDAATSIGILTARRLAPEILPLVADDDG